MGSNSGFQAEVEHNVINAWSPSKGSGRGILVGGKYTSTRNNTITVANRPQVQEYYGYLLGGAYGWQGEKDVAGDITENDTYHIVGDGGGAGFRYNGLSTVSSMNISGSTFWIDIDNATPAKNAACIKFGVDLPSIPDPDLFTFTDCVFKTNHKLFDIDSQNQGMTGTLTLVRPHFNIVNDAAYISGSPWYTIGAGTALLIQDPTYEDSFTQTEIETKEASDSSVTITTS